MSTDIASRSLSLVRPWVGRWSEKIRCWGLRVGSWEQALFLAPVSPNKRRDSIISLLVSYLLKIESMVVHCMRG